MLEPLVSRWGSATLFGAVLLSFLLPFATVACSGDEVTFTGVQLALHQVPEEKSHSATGALAQDVESETTPWAFLALAAAAAAFALAVAGRRGGGVAAAVGLLAMLALLLKAAVTLADVELRVGFALALLGYVAGAVLHACAWRRRRRAGRVGPRDDGRPLTQGDGPAVGRSPG